MPKYEFSDTNISHHVVPYYDFDTSSTHDIPWVFWFVNREVAPSLLSTWFSLHNRARNPNHDTGGEILSPGHLSWVAATLPPPAHAAAAPDAPDIAQWEEQEVSLVRRPSCIVKRGILSSRRYLSTCLTIEQKLYCC